MSKWRRRTQDVEATQWFKNGDHPKDNCETFTDEDETFLERARRLDVIGDQLFARPDASWTPEARLIHRENSNRETLARIKEEPFRPIAISELRNQISAKGGPEVWERLVRREAEKRAVESWRRS